MSLIRIALVSNEHQHLEFHREKSIFKQQHAVPTQSNSEQGNHLTHS